MEEVIFQIFNSPLEVGLRLLFLFSESTKSMDLQRLVYYNYLLIHSSDITGAPPSLHPNLPDRSSEMLVNRKIILNGLSLLFSKGLIEIDYSKTGLKYKKSKQTAFFIGHFESEYSKKLIERAKWVAQTFDSYTDKQLSDFMTSKLGEWGSEFSREFNVIEGNNA